MFLQAWNEAVTDSEKFTTAHYVARHQSSTEDKLKWDITALNFALKINNDSIWSTLSSLYLNIAKCYEDLNDLIAARKNYEAALLYQENLPADGYGQMIKSGIKSGLKRVSEKVKKE